MTDVIADMLTRIRNALLAKHETVEIPASKIKKAIANILLSEGYVSDVKFEEDGVQGKIVITLKYGAAGAKVISGLKKSQQTGPQDLRRLRRNPAGARRHGNRNPLHFQGRYDRQGSEKSAPGRRSARVRLVGGSKYVENRQNAGNAAGGRHG